MKIKGQAEKWVRVILGVVCLLLLVNLVMQLGGVRAGASRGMPGGTRAGPPLPGDALDDLSRYDPVLRLDVLNKLQSRPLTRPARNPFQGPAPPRVEQPAPPPAALPPPPTPPPIPLKAVGFTLKTSGQQEAYVADEQQTYVVHQGETFAQRYRVLNLTSKSIEIEDESTHQKVELPFPQ